MSLRSLQHLLVVGLVLLLTPPTVCIEHCKPCEAQLVRWCLSSAQVAFPSLSTQRRCWSGCLPVFPGWVSMPPTDPTVVWPAPPPCSHHTCLLDMRLPMPSLFLHQRIVHAASKPRILFSSKIFKGTPSLPAGVCSKPYLSWTPSLLILRKKA